MIEVAVFDLGGVLVDWNPRYLYRQLFDDADAMERFLTEVCSPEWNERQDAGRPWREALAELIARHPDHADMILAYHGRWPEMLRGEMVDTVEILKELKTLGLRLYALTNWSHETFPLARGRYEFLNWFDGIVVSGEERVIKPDPAIFHRLLTRYDIVPARAVYIDDSPRNVATAADLGFHALRFVESVPGRKREVLVLNRVQRGIRQELMAAGVCLGRASGANRVDEPQREHAVERQNRRRKPDASSWRSAERWARRTRLGDANEQHAPTATLAADSEERRVNHAGNRPKPHDHVGRLERQPSCALTPWRISQERGRTRKRQKQKKRK